MSSITFDTLAFAEALKKGGFTQQQAEAQARAQGELFANFIEEKLATKDDILRLELATKKDIQHLEKSTKEDIQRLEKEIIRFDSRMGELEMKITIRMGGMLVVAVGILATLMKIL